MAHRYTKAEAGGPPRVVVVGSVNLDVVFEVERLPSPGETLAARACRENTGGKGANQAVAAARAGAKVALVARVGSDDVGSRLRADVARHGVDVAGVEAVDGARSGTAFITVDAAGENTIVIDAGANGAWPTEPAGVRELVSPWLAGADVVVLQHEVPAHVVAGVAGAAAAQEAGVRLMLNAAPAGPVDDAVLECCDPIVLNEPELVMVSGVAGTDAGLSELLRRGAPSVVVTLGALGARWVASTRSRDGEASGSVEAHRARVVDSTGAGDALVGVLAARLADGDPLPEALRRAVTAASLSVERPGTLDSYPTRDEVDAAHL